MSVEFIQFFPGFQTLHTYTPPLFWGRDTRYKIILIKNVILFKDFSIFDILSADHLQYLHKPWEIPDLSEAFKSIQNPIDFRMRKFYISRV